MTYAGFWRRFGAYLVDFIALIPLIAISVYGTNHSRWFQALWLIPGALIGIWFSVHLVVRYGGTPGKLAMRTRIVMDDGSPVTRQAAFVRYSVLFGLSMLTSAALAYTALQIPEEHYMPLSIVQKSMLLAAAAPPWYKGVNIAMNVWVWSEFITILFNKRKKALHDYLAGTVVIRKVA